MNSIDLENTYTSLPPEFFKYTEAETMPELKMIKIMVLKQELVVKIKSTNVIIFFEKNS